MLNRFSLNRPRAARHATLATLLVALLFALAARVPVTHAATITVADGEVAIAANSLCSLREAIINANADAATHGDCDAGVGADTITLPAGGSFVITDSYASYSGNTGLPQVTSAIIIEGNGSTIDRNSATEFRLFAMNSAANLTLNDLTLTDGALNTDVGGGAIANIGGVLTINDSTLSGHSGNNSQGGGAIHASGGTTTINRSTLHTNQANNGGGGGGIYANNTATLNIYDSTIRNSTATNTSGGGIRMNFTGANVLTITGSTVNNNSANSGGGIGLGSGTAIITNSTISGNTSQANGGGIDAASTLLTLNNVTVTGNTAGAGGGGGGGGVYSNTTITFNRSIISGNLGPTGYDSGYEIQGNGSEVANNYNVFGRSGITSNRAFAFSFTPGANDFVATDTGTPTAIGSILNTTLADNGGPTHTHALVAGSPAVDRAPSTACTAAPVDGIDQRGYPRNVDGNAAASANECDAGAYEYLSSPPPTTGTIIIVKEADPADDTPFSFTENIINVGFELTDPTFASINFTLLSPGSYTVTEDGETGWTLDNIDCDDDDSSVDVSGGTASIVLDAGETVTCTFYNSRDTGSIIIVKDADPADDTPFSFTEDISGVGVFTLMDPADNTETFSDVPTGTYTVAEDGETDWTLDDISCDDGNSTGDTGTGEATINLEKDETVTCTFTNSRDTGTIVIVKEATPADDTAFDFTEDITSGGGMFTLSDPSDDTETFNDVPTGTYDVSENVPAPWLLDDIDCDDLNSIENEATATATINLEKDELVVCTFTNSNPPPPAADIYVSALAAGVTSDALAYGPHDVLQWDGSAWSKWFDGSAAGLMPSGRAIHNVNSVWIPDTSGDDVVLSFVQNARVVPGVPGKVNGMDLVWWDGSAFSLWFDGEDVGLTVKTKEKIDALHVLDGSLSPIGGACQYYLLISTQGDGQVPNYGGGALKFDGTDVLGFCMTNSGANTAGYWHRVLNGKAEGMPGQALTSLSASDDGQTLYLTTKGPFNVDSASGSHSMVYRYDMGSGEFSGPYFSAPANGLPTQVDGLHVEGDLP